MKYTINEDPIRTCTELLTLRVFSDEEKQEIYNTYLQIKGVLGAFLNRVEYIGISFEQHIPVKFPDHLKIVVKIEAKFPSLLGQMEFHTTVPIKGDLKSGLMQVPDQIRNSVRRHLKQKIHDHHRHIDCLEVEEPLVGLQL